MDFFNAVLCPFQDFSSYETAQSVGGAKTENSEKQVVQGQRSLSRESTSTVTGQSVVFFFVFFLFLKI